MNTINLDEVDLIPLGQGHIAVPKEKPKIETEFVPYVPFKHVSNGHRKVKARARFFKFLKRRAVTALKRTTGRRLTDEEMRAAKGAVEKWVADQLAVS